MVKRRLAVLLAVAMMLAMLLANAGMASAKSLVIQGNNGNHYGDARHDDNGNHNGGGIGGGRFR